MHIFILQYYTPAFQLLHLTKPSSIIIQTSNLSLLLVYRITTLSCDLHPLVINCACALFKHFLALRQEPGGLNPILYSFILILYFVFILFYFIFYEELSRKESTFQQVSKFLTYNVFYLKDYSTVKLIKREIYFQQVSKFLTYNVLYLKDYSTVKLIKKEIYFQQVSKFLTYSVLYLKDYSTVGLS